MDCFVQGPNYCLVVASNGCIDCSVCVVKCPVSAIVNASEATETQQPYISLNASWPSTRSGGPSFARKRPFLHMLPGAVWRTSRICYEPDPSAVFSIHLI